MGKRKAGKPAGDAAALWRKLQAAEARLQAGAPEERGRLAAERDRIGAAYRKAVRGGGAAGRETAIVTIDNPYRIEGETRTRRERVEVNLAAHPIERLRARGSIDAGEYAAARRFEALFQRAAIGRVGSIDPTRTAVDGGGAGDPLPAATLAAARELDRLAGRMGMLGFLVVQAICIRGLAAREVAAHWARSFGGTGREAATLVMAELRRALGAMDEARGAEGPARARRIGFARAMGLALPDGAAVEAGRVFRTGREAEAWRRAREGEDEGRAAAGRSADGRGGAKAQTDQADGRACPQPETGAEAEAA